MSDRPIVIVMGVAGSGKSSVARVMAECLGVPFLEGDDMHPPNNIAKMSAGFSLADADRQPWLDAISAWIDEQARSNAGGVISCSALRRRYREQLRCAGGTRIRIVMLDVAENVLRERLASREAHFMGPALLADQLTTLERPTPEENVLLVSGTHDIQSAAALIVTWLEEAGVSQPHRP